MAPCCETHHDASEARRLARAHASARAARTGCQTDGVASGLPVALWIALLGILRNWFPFSQYDGVEA